jgi:hypothetical protein
MKGLFLAFNFAFLILGSACQVKENQSVGGLSGHTPATNSFSLQTPASKTFIASETLFLVVTFPFHVTVTGTPRLVLTVGRPMISIQPTQL